MTASSQAFSHIVPARKCSRYFDMNQKGARDANVLRLRVKNLFFNNCINQECASANSFMYSTSAQTPSFGIAL